MTEPVAVARHAMRRVGHDLTGKTVAIYGAGPIGLMVAQWARAMGAETVTLSDLIPQKLEMARKMGFQTGAPPSGADVTVDAAGAPAALSMAMRDARRGGAVVMLGNPSGALQLPAPLWSQLMRREVTVFGTWNSDYSVPGAADDWRAALDAMAAKKLDLQPLISHRVSLDGAIAALRMMKEGQEFYSKVLIYP